ncbi:MAG: hypothetical protein ACE5IK_03855 [Acidobacteriota bacterium]
MHRKELNERSPLRVLDQSIHGGLGPGNLGVVLARHGVGKSAFLVGVALDDLMRGRKVLHISQEHPVEKVRAYYDEIFADLAHEKALSDVWKVRAEMERHRRIHHYLNRSFSVDKLQGTLAFLRDHGDFRPVTILIDDFDFSAASGEDVAALREIARGSEAEMWLSATVHRDVDETSRGIPAPLAARAGAIDVILRMAHDGDAVHITLLKDHDNPDVSDLKLTLDPRSMLIVSEG